MLYFCICVAVCAALLVPAAIYLMYKLFDEMLLVGVFFGVMIGALATALVAPGAAAVSAGFTGGAGCGYKAGVITGTVAAVSVEGQIFDTYEAEIQVGYEGMQETFKVSGKDLRNHLGYMVEINYLSCWLPDYRMGSSGNYVHHVDLVTLEEMDDGARWEEM